MFQSMKINPLTLQRMIVIAFSIVVIMLTLTFRIPSPATGGYINLSDIAVIFCGLFLGGRWGAIVGAIGCAIADAVGGFLMFIPATLVAKGLEGYIAGAYATKKPLWLIVAFVVMALVYFLAELVMPNIGLKSALNELPLNLAQGAIGAVVGWTIYKLVIIAFPNHVQYE